MKRLLSLVICANSWIAGVALANSDEAKKLDYKQAAINERESRVNDISLSWAMYRLIRDYEVYGPEGDLAKVSSWYKDLNAWYNSWGPIISGISAGTMTDTRVQMLSGQIQTQLDKLHAVENSRLAVLSGMDDTQRKMGTIKLYPSNYIKGADAQIQALMGNISRLKEDLSSAKSQFFRESVEGQRKLCNDVIELLKVKAMILTLDFPELKASLEQLEFSFKAFDTIDSFRVEIEKEALAVRKMYVVDNLPLQASQRLKSLQLKHAGYVSKVNAMTAFEKSFRDRVLFSMQFAMNSIEREIADQENDYPGTERFREKYQNEVYSFGFETGLAERCKNMDRSLDCSLMSAILVYPPEKLKEFNEEQLLYLETQLERVKKGFRL